MLSMILLMAVYFAVYPFVEYFMGGYLRGMSLWWLLPAWIIGNSLDCHSTIQFLKTKKVKEANIIIVWFINHFGNFWGPVIGKAVLVIMFSGILLTPATRVTLFSWTIIIFGVAVNNYRLYLKYKEPL